MLSSRKPRAHPTPRAWVMAGLLLLHISLAGQTSETNSTPAFQAIRLPEGETATIDGVLDEPFWARCPVATGLIDIRTHRPASQQTTIRAAYCQSFIYIGVECFDDKISEVRASERRKDRVFSGDDWVEIHFDPAHSHRGKYAFFTNPLGTKAEANEGPSGVFNYGWTVEWDCQARIETNRWCFEMKIPLGTMNYLRKDGQTWGFNVTRMLRRLDQTSFWSFSPTESYKPRHFGHLGGLELADTKFDRLWEVTPYLSARHDFGNGNSDTILKAGGDIGFRLTPSITTALTLNPDYGQVEADDATIELRDTERFLTEKRPFFREGEELMRMSHRLYYSRRFTDIDAAAKVTGAQQNFSFNFQNIYGKTEHQDFSGDGNSALLRVYQYLGDRSYAGYYLADSELKEGHSRVAGADTYLFFNDDWRAALQLAGMNQDLPDRSGTFDNKGYNCLADASLIYSRYPVEVNWGLKGISDGFKPLLGYIPRQNIYGPNFDVFYNHKSDSRWYKDLNASYMFDYYLDNERKLAIHDHWISGRVVLQNDLGLRATYANEYHAPYHNYRASSGLDLFSSALWKSASLTAARGRFEKIDYTELILGKPLKPWNRLPIRLESVLRWEDHPDGSQQTKWLARAVFDFYITDDMWIKGSLQPQDSDVHNVSLIYGWEFLPRRHFYLVFNSVNDGSRTVNSIFSKLTWTF